MCDNCLCKPVCSIYRATGGVKKCEHFKEERRGRWISWQERWGGNPFMDFGRKKLGVFCSRTDCGMYSDNPTDYCHNCGADMRGAEDGN